MNELLKLQTIRGITGLIFTSNFLIGINTHPDRLDTIALLKAAVDAEHPNSLPGGHLGRPRYTRYFLGVFALRFFTT